MKKLLIVVSMALLMLLSLNTAALATNGTQGVIDNYLGITVGQACAALTQDPPKIEGIFCVLGRTIDILLGLIGGVSLLFLVFGGLQYMASGGDEKALTAAKAAITYSVLGLIIVLFTVLGMDILLRFLGVF